MARTKLFAVLLMLLLCACGANRRAMRAEREMKRLLIRFPELYVVDSLRGVLTVDAPAQALAISLPRADTMRFAKDGWTGVIIIDSTDVSANITAPEQTIEAPYELPYQKVKPPLQTQPVSRNYWPIVGIVGAILLFFLIPWRRRSDPNA